MSSNRAPRISRRRFFKLAATATALTGAGLLPAAFAHAGHHMVKDKGYRHMPMHFMAAHHGMSHQLPYPVSALEPIISAKTVAYHYGKHTLGYYKKTARFIGGTPYQDMSLVQIITATSGREDRKAIFNNAAQAWNHTFYWRGLAPLGGGRPGNTLSAAIDASFGSFGRFRDRFVTQAASVFGSGWVWLVDTGSGLDIIGTQNAETPITMGHVPLFVVDVWEHAYYLDYQNRRKAYVQAILDRLVDWYEVTRRYENGTA
jgi:Fe-Mn family superoxide dismutase